MVAEERDARCGAARERQSDGREREKESGTKGIAADRV